jgi:hypothetical protein
MERNVGITIRLPRKQRETLHKKAQHTGISLTKFLISSALSERGAAHKEDREAIGKLLYEVRKAGNNLNQIAHEIHASKFTNARTPTETEIIETVSELKEAIKTIKKRL